MFWRNNQVTLPGDPTREHDSQEFPLEVLPERFSNVGVPILVASWLLHKSSLLVVPLFFSVVFQRRLHGSQP